MQVDVLTRSTGSFGVIFRMQDPFNFLALQINIEVGFKKIVKSVNGVMSVLHTINDGGIAQNNWHKILIKAKKSNFEVKFGESKRYEDYNSMPLLFKFNDNQFTHGK